MRATATIFVMSLSFVATACPDSEPTTPTADTTPSTDTSNDAGDPDTSVLDTGAPDVGAPDVGTPDVGAPDVVIPPDVTAPDVPATPNNCLEHFACAAVTCSSSSAADLATCLEGVPAACGIATDGSDPEGDLAGTLAECVATNGCVLDSSKDMYECLADNCLPAAASCQAGPTFGTETSCFALQSCSNAQCTVGITGVPDFDCLRDCAKEYTQAAVEAYLDLRFCLEANCADADDKTICFQQMQSNPLCASQVTGCPNI